MERLSETWRWINARDLLPIVAAGQGAYFALTGLWALVSIRTFQMVTGPKTDLWLVKTVGALVGVIGGVLGLAASRRRVEPEIVLLGVGSAASLGTVDMIYVARKRIAPIYLLDALAELLLIAAWGHAWYHRSRQDAAHL